MLNKLKTALTLLGRGDLPGFTRHIRLNLRRQRAARARGRPFVHRRLGFDFLCFPDVADSLELYLQGSADSLELSLLQAWSEPRDAIMDVGSNLGIYAIAAAHAAREPGRILAIEPSPTLTERIEQTARQLGWTTLQVCQACAGEAGGETEFFMADTTGNTGEQSRRVDPSRQSQYQRISVKMSTLDQLAQTQLNGCTPSFVKLDIEGAEVSALRGASDLLNAADVAFWLVEINPAALQRFGSCAADVIAHFPSARFENWLLPQYPRTPGQPARPRPLSPGDRLEDALFYNLAALPRHGQWAHRSGRVRALLHAS